MKLEIVPQEEAWVKQAKRNLTDLYENRLPERMPFEFQAFDISGEYKPKIPTPATPPTPEKSIADVRREFFDAEARLKPQLESIAKWVRQGFWDDTIRALHPISSATGWLAEVFGAKTEWFPTRPPYPHPAIFEPQEIDHLRPDFQGSELYQAAIQHLRFYRDAIGDRIPIGAPDLQSPVDVASMIMDYTHLVYAMMDEPKRVHTLMRMVTEAMIHACREFRKEMTDYPLSSFDWWLPRGIFVSDDLQAVLNPELFKEFAVPYNEMLAKEFGGLATHSCGRILHNVENVAATKGLIAFNTHDPLFRLAPIVQNRCAIIIFSIAEVMSPHHPECKRPFLKTPDELEQFWRNDFQRLRESKGQRVLYVCHAPLSSKHTAQETYDQMLAISRELVKGLAPA